MNKRNLNKKIVNPKNNFFLIAGPCAIEGEDMALRIAEHLVHITDNLKIPFYFKGSFKKANRSRLDSFTGIGDEKALKILDKVRDNFRVPTLTDVHSVNHVEMVASYVDVIQIPAFLIRQTDLIVAAAKTGKIVNLKKGQFMSPESMKHAVKKVVDSGNKQAWVTDRGTMFGYQDMLVDFRGIPKMKEIAPTILDVTHSLQKPNQSGGVTGGQPEMIETIARAGIAAGVDGLFLETHFDPKNAKSDGANMLHLNEINPMMNRLVQIRQTINSL